LNAYDKAVKFHTIITPVLFENIVRIPFRNLPAPSWKHSTSPTSLINSYSARRRSVLATDMPSSPSKKLVPPKEECIDLSAAINRFMLMFPLSFSPSIFSIFFMPS
uniref:Ovule protein n=1 Tax=Angiostrongylus cantonensis TaxID=6313 RepID=A0A0K0CYF8_ANGCA